MNKDVFRGKMKFAAMVLTIIFGYSALVWYGSKSDQTKQADQTEQIAVVSSSVTPSSAVVGDFNSQFEGEFGFPCGQYAHFASEAGFHLDFLVQYDHQMKVSRIHTEARYPAAKALSDRCKATLKLKKSVNQQIAAEVK